MVLRMGAGEVVFVGEMGSKELYRRDSGGGAQVQRQGRLQTVGEVVRGFWKMRWTVGEVGRDGLGRGVCWSAAISG